ncbi:MAG: phosphohistidine phosphatase [Polyangiales bacterium]|jgi:phosphohistidine phosphatase
MRHSTAVDPYEAPTDETRWLTSEGRARMRVVTPMLRDALGPITHMFTSSLVRAVQTADLLGEGLGFQGAITVHRALAPEFGTTAQALSVLEGLDPKATVVLVTHAPKVRVLAGHLSGEGKLPGFRTASACCIDIDRNGAGKIAFWLDPTAAQILSTPPTH